MRAWWTVALALTAAGCTLLVSTSDLSTALTPPTPPPDGGGPADSSVAPLDASTIPEAGADTGTSTELPGLIGKWLFDDGTAKDSSGKGNHGTLQGTAMVGDTTRGKSLVLSGNGFMQVSSLEGAAFPHSGTFSIWCRWAQMNKADTHILLDGWDPGRRHVVLRHANDAAIGEFQFALQQRSTNYVAEGYADVPMDAWQHLVVSWDRVKHSAVLYQNGKLVSRDDYEGDFVPDEQEVIFGQYLNGGIDDIRLFDRALSDEEAIALR